MAIINEQLLARVNGLLQNAGIKVQALPAGGAAVDGFYVVGLPTGPQIITMPEWYIEDWHKGFGGWVLTSGRTVRYARTCLSHHNIFQAVYEVNAAALPNAQGKRKDMRTQEVEDWIREELLGADGFYFQNIWGRLAEVIAESLLNVREGRSSEAKNKGVNNVRKAVSEFMNSFQPVRSRIEHENTNLTKFLQYTCDMGYPEEGLPGGVSGFFRNAFVNHMVETTKQGGIKNIWGEGPFKAVVSCTGKTMAGEWVTLVPPVSNRVNSEGIMEQVEGLNTPLMIAATCPIGYNAKRHFRETNAIARAQKIYDPKPIVHGMINGYECNLGPDLESRQTEVCVCIGGLIGINLYPDPNHDGEYLNLDDIILTPKGRQMMQSEYRKEYEFSAEEWKDTMSNFMEEDGKAKEGYELEPRVVRSTSVEGNDLFTAEMIVKGPVHRDPDIVGKTFVQGLKAMSKSILSRLVGVDRAGKEFDIDIVISGHSILEKKMPFIPLQAMASRVGIRYWEDFENPISSHRKQRGKDEEYIKWACKHDDLVRKTCLELVVQQENPDGTIKIYSITEGLDGKEPTRVYVGNAVVGWTRASRLYESERTGTKTKRKDAMPYGTYIRILANQELKRNPEVLRQFNMAAEIYRSTMQFQTSGDGDSNYPKELQMELE